MAEGKKILKYSKNDLLKAVDAINNGMSKHQASKQFNIPRSTLIAKIQGKYSLCKSIGAPTIFSKVEEDMLVEWVMELARAGFPVTRQCFLESVQKLSLTLGKTEFAEKMPGKKWYHLFLKRHSMLSLRTPQNLATNRSALQQHQIEGWFLEVDEYIKSRDDLSDAMKDPKRIFNADEAAFFLNPKGDKVIVARGEKNVYLKCGSEKENPKKKVPEIDEEEIIAEGAELDSNLLTPSPMKKDETIAAGDFVQLQRF